MTWSVRGIDDEVREAALAAARRSGKPVGEWLNGVIRQTSTPEPTTASAVPNDEVGRLERGLAALAERLDRLRTPEAPVARERADLGPIAAALQEQIDRLTPAPQPQHRAAPTRERLRAEVQFVAEPQEDPRLGSVLDALNALDRRLQTMATPARAAQSQPLPAQAPAAAVAPPPPPAPVLAAPQPAVMPGGADRLGDLERAIAAIGRRQQALEPERAPGPERRPAARPLLASDMERHFKELTGRLDKLAASPATARPADERLGSELRDLRGVVEQGFATRLAPIADSVGELRAGLDRLQQEMARSRRDDRLDAVLEGLAALRDDVVDVRRADPAPLAAFERAHADLVRRLDALRADAADAGAVADLRAEIAELRTSLSTRDSDAGIAALESRLVALGRRIDQLVAGRGESFAALDEIRDALAERRPAPDFGRVEARLDALDRHMETLNAVEARIGDLGARLDTLEPGGVPPAALAAIADEITGLGRRLDRLPKTGGAASEEVLATVADRLQDLGAGIDRLERRSGLAATGGVDLPMLGALADRIEAAAARLDRVTPAARDAETDTTLIAAIDDKFAQIARQLDTAEDRFTTLGAIEDALVEIHRLVSQRGPSGSPEEAARAAVAEFARLAERDGSGKALDSVVTELETLRAQTQGLEARTADGLKAVQEALTSVAGLLQQGRGVDGVSRAARNPREDARPLEPGSGKPDPAPEMPRAAAPAPVVVAPVAPVEDDVTEAVAADGLASSRRADFIAAARRAAQAAQTARIAEPQPELDDPDAAQTRQGPLARIGAALRGRTRPVATIIAVLLLAGIATEISLNGLERLRRGLEPVGDRIVALTPAPSPTMAPTAPVVAPKADPVETGTVARPPVTTPRAAAPAAEALAAPMQPGTFSTAPAVRDGFVADSIETGAIAPKLAPAAPQATAPAARPSYPLPEEKAGSLALRQAAAAGEPQAAFEIAQRYAEGRGVAQNGTAAIEWFRRAAEAGFAPAQYRLASGLEKGMGGNRDLTEAKRWYQAAADQGNVRAMHNLGVIFANERDMTNALPWFQKAGDLGLKDSQFNLGIIHALGSGVKQDLAVSYKWFSLAAAQGDQEAGKKRDDIAQYLDKTALASAKLAVDTWKARPLERAANDETTRWAGEIAPAQSADAERVSRVQTLLKAQGAYAGPVDGQASADTKAAVKAFQRKAGLKPTGEVDDALVRALSAGKTAA